MKAKQPPRLYCQACRAIAEEGHEHTDAHVRSDDAWRSWMRIEHALAMVDPAPCPPQWRPVG